MKQSNTPKDKRKEEIDFTKRHYELDRDDTKVWCTRCGKIVEERDFLPDYTMFLGGVFIKKNLPCSKLHQSKSP